MDTGEYEIESYRKRYGELEIVQVYGTADVEESAYWYIIKYSDDIEVPYSIIYQTRSLRNVTEYLKGYIHADYELSI